MFKRLLPFLILTLIAKYNSAQVDTNYIKTYKNRLAISIFQSIRSYTVGITQTLTQDTANLSSHSYIAQANKVTGFSIGYDKLAFDFGIATPATPEFERRYGKTRSINYGLTFSAFKVRFETALRINKGFYDEFTSRYTPGFTDTSAFYQKPNLNNVLFKAKGIYFFNRKKFSYSAAYANTSRQIKTKGSFFLFGGYYFNKFENDSSFLPFSTRLFYQEFSNVNRFTMNTVFFGGGYTLTVVIAKNFYANLFLGLGAEFRNRTLRNNTSVLVNDWAINVSNFDARGALGYNGKNFYVSVSFNTDYIINRFAGFAISNTIYNGFFKIGYRFKVKERNWFKKLKENKYYKML